MRTFPRACPYIVLSTVAAASAAWLIADGVSVVARSLVWPAAVLAAVIAYLARIRRFPPRAGRLAALMERQATALTGMIFLQVAWMTLLIFNHLAMTVRWPLADGTLAGWDAALGFDWVEYLILVASNPSLSDVLALSYNALTPLSIAAFLVLAFSEDRLRCAYFVEAFFLSALVCIVAGSFFPAEGAAMHYLRGAVPEAALRGMPGLYHLDALHYLRGGAPFALEPLQLSGLVTFPSFHTAGAIVIATAFLRTRWFWPSFAYAAVMIAATPIFGSHYFCDLIAGAAVAAGVLAVLARSGHYRGVLDSLPAELGIAQLLRQIPALRAGSG